MRFCNQVCKWNTYAEGCTKPFDEVCPLSNMSVARGTNVITNAQHIRSMTDEELMHWCNHTCPLNEKWKSCDGCDLDEFDKCEKCWMDWLKQPYEENQND